MKQIFLALSLVLAGTAAFADATVDSAQFSLLEVGAGKVVSSQDFNDLSAATYKTTKKLAETLDQHEWTIVRGFKAVDQKLTNVAVGEGKLAIRIAELERKVAGMQKEITRLHAIKANK